MSSEPNHEALLSDVLERMVSDNRQAKPGTPLAELKAAVESAVADLPPLEFEEFTQAINDTEAIDRLVARAPEIIGWNADQIVQWVEQISGKISTPRET